MPADSKFHDEMPDITITCKCVAKQLLNVNHSKAAGPDELKHRLLSEFTKHYIENKRPSSTNLTTSWR